MTTRTRGPWHIESLTNDVGSRRICAPNGEILGFCGTFPAERAYANARLMAAAPDLLATLRNIADNLYDHPLFMHQEATQEQITSEGGDAAFITFLYKLAQSAIDKVV